MHYVGVDLAWGPNGTTGLAVLDTRGHLLAVDRAKTDGEILAWLGRWTRGACVAGFDAPIVVTNATGSRPCEKLTGRYFGRYHASCYPANTSIPVFRDGGRARRLTGQLELAIGPGRGDRQALEVYPHVAIVMLAGLPSVLRYKNKPGRSLELLRAETVRLAGLLEGLAGDPVPLHVHSSPDWAALRATVAGATTKAALHGCEDPLDAIVCAYIAMLADLAPDRVRTLGRPAEGSITVPVTPAVAALIDADQAAAAVLS